MNNSSVDEASQRKMMKMVMMITMILSDLSMGLKSLLWLALRGRASLHAGFLPFLHLRTQAQLYSLPQLRFKSSSPFAALPLPAELGVAFPSTISSLRARSMRSEDGSSFVTSSSHSALCSSTFPCPDHLPSATHLLQSPRSWQSPSRIHRRVSLFQTT